jgi:hypothetical protein
VSWPTANRKPRAERVGVAKRPASALVYRSIDELQADLDAWIIEYNEAWPHRRWYFGKTPMHNVLDAMPMAKEKMIAA